MTELRTAISWLRARISATDRNEDGFGAVEWMLILLGVIAIAGLAVVAVTNYLQQQTGKLK
jgi:hypothetical protein